MDFFIFVQTTHDNLKDILLLTPPFTQLNTPYPATAYLKGFLNTKNIRSYQMDLGLEVLLNLFTKKGLELMFRQTLESPKVPSDNSKRMLALKEAYVETIDDVVAFLQGKNQTLARKICGEDFLPQASRFDQLDDLEWAFGIMGFQNKAKHLATLYLEDLSDFMVENIDEHFGFSRYAEKLGRSANSFDELNNSLQAEPGMIDQLTIDLLDVQLKRHQPKLVGISVPFPGNLYSAFRCAQHIRKNYPDICIVMGGGFPNTELRGLTDVRVFDFFDYITLDDGPLPLEIIITNQLKEGLAKNEFKRTLLKENGKVVYNDLSSIKDYRQKDWGCPDYSDLPLNQYISVLEVTNPMHSLWSDGRWNKLTMAHGCYWGKCAFCDITLDYIRNFEPLSASLLVDQMEELIKQTGEKGFHFVDEAAPPSLMAEMAMEIMRRGLNVTWWTNIRFEKSFTKDLCQLLKASGCIAVSGGLEVASDRLLSLINKGVTIEQVANVTDHFSQAGILVHAYLMYGFPTQTVQETVDSLEMVRQLFEIGSIQSGFWHQFSLTAHSPILKDPGRYGIIPEIINTPFANNDLAFKHQSGIHHEKFSFGLKKSLLNFMNGIGFELSLQTWFDFKIPPTRIPHYFIQKYLNNQEPISLKPTSKIIWLGAMPTLTVTTKIKKGQTREFAVLTFQGRTETIPITMDKDKGLWFMTLLEKIVLQNKKSFTFSQLKEDYETHFEEFDQFWHSKAINSLRGKALLAVL